MMRRQRRSGYLLLTFSSSPRSRPSTRRLHYARHLWRSPSGLNWDRGIHENAIPRRRQCCVRAMLPPGLTTAVQKTPSPVTPRPLRPL